MNEVKNNFKYFIVPNDIYEIGLSTYEIAVYSYLARCSNNSLAFPSYETIRKKTGMSRRKATNVVKELIARRLIVKNKGKNFTIENEEGKMVKIKSNIYFVMAPDNSVIKPVDNKKDTKNNTTEKKQPVHDMHPTGAPHALELVHQVHPINNYNIKPKYKSSNSKKIKKYKSSDIFKNISNDAAIENIKSIAQRFKNITNKNPTEKDILDIHEILYSSQGAHLDIKKREKIFIDTIHTVQNRESGKKINSINYFKMPIFENFKKSVPFKLDNKLF